MPLELTIYRFVSLGPSICMFPSDADYSLFFSYLNDRVRLARDVKIQLVLLLLSLCLSPPHLSLCLSLCVRVRVFLVLFQSPIFIS